MLLDDLRNEHRDRLLRQARFQMIDEFQEWNIDSAARCRKKTKLRWILPGTARSLLDMILPLFLQNLAYLIFAGPAVTCMAITSGARRMASESAYFEGSVQPSIATIMSAAFVSHTKGVSLRIRK